jgi:hypothetical protein
MNDLPLLALIFRPRGRKGRKNGPQMINVKKRQERLFSQPKKPKRKRGLKGKME